MEQTFRKKTDKPKMEQKTSNKNKDHEMAVKYGHDNAGDLGVADASLGKPLKSKEDFERSMREKLSDVKEAGVDVDNLDLYSKYKESYNNYKPSNNIDGDKIVGNYMDDNGMKYHIVQAPNGKYFNEYESSNAGPFESLEEAKKMMAKHRPNATENGGYKKEEAANANLWDIQKIDNDWGKAMDILNKRKKAHEEYNNKNNKNLSYKEFANMNILNSNNEKSKEFIKRNARI